MYLTLPDAHTVNVIARRIGERSSLKGRAYFKDVKLEKFISEVDTKIPYLSVNVSKSLDGNKIYFMVINKHMEENITSTIDLSDFTPDSEGTAWILNGPSVDATNEKEHENIRITQKRFEIKGNPFYFTFEPHSLTAIEIVSRVSLK
jgi:alpha-L-arabinofuranosidase